MSVTATKQLPVLVSILRSLSVILLFCLPFHFYAPVRGTTGIKYGIVFWDAVLHISIVPIVAITVVIGLWIVTRDKQTGNSSKGPSSSLPMTFGSDEPLSVPKATKQTFVCIARRISGMWRVPLVETSVLGIVLAVTVAQAIQSQLQVVHPGWIWNPALWGTYRVYDTNDIRKATQDLCLDDVLMEMKGSPLCLSRSNWSELRYVY